MTDPSGDGQSEPDQSTDAAELYGLTPQLFTEARNALVKRLRASGRRAEASAVARLRKPPATAWALNQVARLQHDVVASVLDAGDQLRAATQAALGGDTSALRPARDAERQSVATALAGATRHLEEAGHTATDAARRRIEATLRAAMVDESVAMRLSAGVLDGDHDAPGFGFDPSAFVTGEGSVRPETGAKPPAPTAAADDGDAVDDADDDVDQAADTRRQDEARQQAADQSAARLLAARRERLTKQADQLARRAEELEATAQGTEASARKARQAADRAAAEAREARLRLEELS